MNNIFQYDYPADLQPIMSARKINSITLTHTLTHTLTKNTISHECQG